MLGPGKYDKLAEHCLKESQAEAVVVIVFNGNRGDGMSGKETVTDWETALRGGKLQDKLPTILRHIAKAIESAPAGSFVATTDS